ncbi:MAG: hypothetical protein PHE78_03630 [Candidatus Gastranaerophilales bacterium]|nr:hypothetical protein [Candidatus Gastranaerophilales bacterium]
MPFNYGTVGFGQLPYGISAFSNADVISTGGLWSDDNTVFNLNSPLVRSLPMTQNLFYGGFNCNPYMNFNPVQNNFDSLLQLQAARGTAASGQSNMGNLLQMMLMMKQLQALSNPKAASNAEETKTTSEQIIDTTEKDEAEKESQVKDALELEFDKEKPLTSIKAFVKNKNDDTTFEYGKFDEFASSTYSAIGKENKGHVTIRESLKTFGIDYDKLSAEEQSKIKSVANIGTAKVNISKSDKKFKDDDVFISENTFKNILKTIGFKKDETSINRSELTKSNIEKIEKAKNVSPSYTDLKSKFTQTKGDYLEWDEVNKEMNKITANKDSVNKFISNELDKSNHFNSKHGEGAKSLLHSYIVAKADKYDNWFDGKDSSDAEKEVLNILKDMKAKSGNSAEYKAMLKQLADELKDSNPLSYGFMQAISNGSLAINNQKSDKVLMADASMMAM